HAHVCHHVQIGCCVGARGPIKCQTFRENQSVLRAHGVTDKGRVRPINEDCWAFDAAQGLCVVADGLGGHNAGEVAAQVAVETVVTFLTTSTSDNNWPFGYDPD